MSLLYSQLDDMDSSLDNLQAEMSDVAERDGMWPADDDEEVIMWYLHCRPIFPSILFFPISQSRCSPVMFEFMGPSILDVRMKGEG